MWMLPQNIIGFLFWVILKLSKNITNIFPYKECVVFRFKGFSFISGGSLGRYIFIREYHSLKTVKHEYGHYRQGVIFGPTYFIFIGVPSVFNNIRGRLDKEFNLRYYSVYPEKWANKLGGVE